MWLLAIPEGVSMFGGWYMGVSLHRESWHFPRHRWNLEHFELLLRRPYGYLLLNWISCSNRQLKACKWAIARFSRGSQKERILGWICRCQACWSLSWRCVSWTSETCTLWSEPFISNRAEAYMNQWEDKWPDLKVDNEMVRAFTMPPRLPVNTIEAWKEAVF